MIADEIEFVDSDGAHWFTRDGKLIGPLTKLNPPNPFEEKEEELADWERELLAEQEVVNTASEAPDEVNHPDHYTWHPSGIEAIEVTEWMGFCLGNAVKYIWRAGQKGDMVKDLEKAKWYIDREIARVGRLL